MGFLQAAGAMALAVVGVQAQKMAEYRTSTNLVYKIAIPDVAAAPFDMVFSITAPTGTGWAGFASGGSMLQNPLLVAWPNGGSVVVSPRWAGSYTLPQPYAGASVLIYPTSSVNSTHWTANFLCKGCSSWDGGSLNPQGANPFAWALSARAVARPADPSSTFGYHSGKDHFSFDLSKARLPAADFDALIASISGAAPAPRPQPQPPLSPSSPATPGTPVPPLNPTTAVPPVVVSPTTLVSTTLVSKPTVETSVVTLPPVTTVAPPLPPVPTTPVVPGPVPDVPFEGPKPPAPTPDIPYQPPAPIPIPIPIPVPQPQPQPQPQPSPVVPPFVPPWVTGRPGRPPFRGPPGRRPPFRGRPGRGRPGRGEADEVDELVE